jgi:hypothetical protein
VAGKDHADYYYVKWSAYAELDGAEQPISGLRIEYKLDTLPSAQILLTVGREPTSNKEAGTVEAFLQAKPYTKVKIYIKGETEMDSPKGSSDPGFPYNEDVMVFDGYLQGLTYRSRRTPVGGSTVSLVANCVGWLAALGGSVSSTQTNTVKGPGGFDEIINLGPGGAAFDVSSTFNVDARGVITDLWLRYLKEMFIAMTATEQKNVWGGTSNDAAFEALQRMDNYGPLSGNTGGSTELPLEFPISRMGIDAKYIQKFLVDQLGQTIYGMWRNHDMWTVLTTLADDFKFTIIPLIDTAYCAPVFPTLSEEPMKTIGADEYYSIDYEADAQSNFVRLAVVDNTGSTSNPFATGARVSAVIGLYEIANVLEGLTKEISAPSWLTIVSSNGVLTRKSIGGDKLGIPDCVNPDAFSEKPDDNYDEIYSNYVTSEIGDDYAQLALQALFLGLRLGTLSGRFRLDIAPGSTIAIEVVNDKFSTPDAEPALIYAIVTGVRLELNAGSFQGTGNAGTTFSISHIRSKDEHENPDLTAREHPIYRARFVGVPLWFE